MFFFCLQGISGILLLNELPQMNASESSLNEVASEGLNAPDTMADFILNSKMPIVEVVVPFSIDITPPNWLYENYTDGSGGTNGNTTETSSSHEITASDTLTNKKVSSNKKNLKLETEDSTTIQEKKLSVMSVGKLEKSVVSARETNKKEKLVRSWLLTPLSQKDMDHDRNEESWMDTLMHLAEDKIYLFGFYERAEREESLLEKRSIRRKRGKVLENTQASKRRNTNGDSQVTSDFGPVSFSFVRWSHDHGLINTEPDTVLPNPLESTSILTPDEKNTFSRYALSSGKLRKECADPYQFLTARIVELRHNLEERIASGFKCEERSKGDV
ncbi:uncharacterized protein TM35_000331370 [Trypanosoma theileri]|uniref:Uncharacterized protein n=1 Tax=Trypanosoma theileri TaxID=67003 RepID=A0A1X0NNG3_9TRYP|nr:uncharacterized protein TM35_000331370 [Trypanosoma theileri]ORC85680.1 hypothetical protein TM35_000331370 [Trypanosoma theileri]